MFSTKGVDENGSKYIGYGVQEVKVIKVEGKEAEGNSNPAITITFQELKGTKEAAVRFSLSEKASKNSLRKIKHLATKLEGVTTEAVDAITASTASEYATKLGTLINNKPVRVKFSGQEIDGVSKGKNNWFKADIGFPVFAESITVPAANTTLVFNNNTDLRRVAAVSPTPVGATGAQDDLPF